MSVDDIYTTVLQGRDFGDANPPRDLPVQQLPWHPQLLLGGVALSDFRSNPGGCLLAAGLLFIFFICGTEKCYNIFMEFVTKNPEETEQLARRVIHAIQSRKTKPGTATIVALSGELGAGKTAFVKGIAKALGLSETVTSPTFVIEKIYYLENMHPYTHLVHLDCYRLESGKELLSIGWNETATDPENLIFLEWPEKVEDILPLRVSRIDFEVIDPTTRKISVDKRLLAD